MTLRDKLASILFKLRFPDGDWKTGNVSQYSAPSEKLAYSFRMEAEHVLKECFAEFDPDSEVVTPLIPPEYHRRYT